MPEADVPNDQTNVECLMLAAQQTPKIRAVTPACDPVADLTRRRDPSGELRD